MSTSTMRVPTSFRLQENLLEELKACAKAANRSLNNYVESILMEVVNTTKSKADYNITPELQAKIDKARGEIKEGQCVELKSYEDIDKYFASL